MAAERLRAAEVAEWLSVSESTVRRMVKSGEWAAGRDRRGMWVSRAALQVWLDARTRESEVRAWWAPGRPVRVRDGGRSA